MNYGNTGCVAMVRYVPRPVDQLRGRTRARWLSHRHSARRPRQAGYLPAVRLPPAHTRLVNEPQPMSAEDRAELEHRREQERLALDGKRYERVRPL
jgi:hypothetical protein